MTTPLSHHRSVPAWAGASRLPGGRQARTGPLRAPVEGRRFTAVPDCVEAI